MLHLGRPVPADIILYGFTQWGTTPLQVAVASGELSEAELYDYTHDDAPDRWKPLAPEDEDERSHISPPLAWVYLEGVGNLSLAELVGLGYLSPTNNADAGHLSFSLDVMYVLWFKSSKKHTGNHISICRVQPLDHTVP